MDHDTVCPRCGATLHEGQAAWLSGPKGYLPSLLWVHQRPDGKGKCHLYSGPRVGGYADRDGRGTVSATTLSAGTEPPERHD